MVDYVRVEYVEVWWVMCGFDRFVEVYVVWMCVVEFYVEQFEFDEIGLCISMEGCL